MTARSGISPSSTSDTTAAECEPGGRWTRADSVRSAAAVLLLLGGSVLATSGTSGVERTVFLTVNRLPDVLRWPIWVPMQLGSLAGALLASIALGWWRRRPSITLAAGTAVVVSWLAAKQVKANVGRGRPMDEGIDTILHEPLEGGLGFVSGHAVIVFALYAVAAAHLPRPARIPALALAVLVAVARVYMGAHLPLDVLSGAALGLLIGQAIRAVEARWWDGRQTEG